MTLVGTDAKRTTRAQRAAALRRKRSKPQGGRRQAHQRSHLCKAQVEGINLSQFVPGLWLPMATNTPQNIPERRNIYPKIPIKTALSRRQQGFESPTGCPQPKHRGKIAFTPHREGAVFAFESFDCNLTLIHYFVSSEGSQVDASGIKIISIP